MKRFSFFLITMLLLLVLLLVFVGQNNTLTGSLIFFGWTIPPLSVGMLTLVSLFSGIILMWLVFIMVSLNNNAKHNREIREKDRLLKGIQAEKEKIQEELSRLKLEISGKVSDETKKENNSISGKVSDEKKKETSGKFSDKKKRETSGKVSDETEKETDETEKEIDETSNPT